MSRRSLVPLFVVLAALLLHLPAHLSPFGSPASREALPEDAPALTENPHLARQGGEALPSLVSRAVSDPQAAWGQGDDTVGRSRFRPATALVFVAERAAGGPDTARLAGWVSLALHLLLVFLAVRLLEDLSVPTAGLWLGGLLVAASPAALPAAAWPAHQGIALAACLGAAGLRVGLRSGPWRALAAGALLAAAGLAHEMAFALILALPVLRAAVRRPALGAWPALLPWLAAVVLRQAVLHDWHRELPGAVEGPEPGLLDGALGIVVGTAELLLPARLHFAQGPWTAGFLGHLFALVALGLAAAWLLRAQRGPARALLAAGLLALAPLLLVGWTGGAPFASDLLYPALPLLAGGLGAGIAAVVARGGAARTAAVAAGALLLGANVAATLARAPAFRTRGGLIELARQEQPASLVSRAWGLAHRTQSATDPGAIVALGPEVARLAAEARGPAAAALREDPVAAVTVGNFLTEYARLAAEADLEPGAPQYQHALDAALGGATLLPRWYRPWYVLAHAARRMGAVFDAYGAIARAVELTGGDLDVRLFGVQVALDVGNVEFAADQMDLLLEEERARALDRGESPRPEVLRLYARAMDADGVRRVPDPLGDAGMRYRYEIAIAVLRDLLQRDPRDLEARRQLYRTYVHYADVLSSLDRPSLALVAYSEALQLDIADPAKEAETHLGWLRDRLLEEERAAESALERAQAGEGNVVDALVRLAEVYSRQARWQEAEEVFDHIERQLPEFPPLLRYHRATALYTVPQPARARAELQRVIEEDPRIARAYHALGELQEEAGRYEEARETYELGRVALEAQARDGLLEDWYTDLYDRLRILSEFLESGPR